MKSMPSKYAAYIRFNGRVVGSDSPPLCIAETYEELLKRMQAYLEREKEIHKPNEEVKIEWNGQNVINVIVYDTAARFSNRATQLRATIILNETPDTPEERLSETGDRNDTSNPDKELPYRPTHTALEITVAGHLRTWCNNLEAYYGYTTAEAIGAIANALQMINEENNGQDRLHQINTSSTTSTTTKQRNHH